ncbi:DUF4314 domain-containing protein [Dactylosporangium matsuzakiense]|uniref:DUF4314 domain-containing protein n=1 Tax=Dactylosporangium matsuzakiense TaxID=53360 RepID=A0A9W6NPX4_9ACTN|nr:DUF4314 domain-containing protein [Dactylosporangium matsuzakiense]UWZ44651.1 DUF4314 domain-containing protein [Dactylosporangium matsuzakiense]GLL04661.1 hypothetical protein GCM10017581_064080 [Dactylosporangium matsuzakiense]
MQYEPGQRVVLVRTGDPHTGLRPGDEGTVRRYDAARRRVDVAWDSGATLSMLLDSGNVITSIPASPADAAGPAHPAGPAGAATRPELLDVLRAAGAADGATAAAWWLQDTIGGRAGGDTAATARRILDGIDDEDPAVLDTFPSPVQDWAGGIDVPRPATVSAAVGSDHAASLLTGEQWQQAEDAYRDSYSIAVTDTIAAACRHRLHPNGDDRDLSHLHPDNVTFGSVGVFSGDWNDAGVMAAHPLTAGYVGTLVDRWNGWAVFTCTRPVAEAIVTDQQQVRDAYRADLAAAGVPAADLDRQTDETYTRLSWDGDVIVADSRTLHDDPQAIERIGPDEQGRYVVMGRSWCWEAVDPYHCARIVGDLPDPDASQEWVLLTHTPYTRVGPAPYTIGGLVGMGTSHGLAGALRYDAAPVAAVLGVTAFTSAVPAARLAATTGRFDADGWLAFVAVARRCGEPMTEAAVLDALAEDALLGMEVAAAAAAGGTVARLLDDTGTILDLAQIHPAPANLEAVSALRGRLRTARRDPRGVEWQYWNGRAWRHLTSTAAAAHPPASGPTTTAT